MTKWVGYAGRSELWVQDDLWLTWKFPHPSITTDDPHWLLKWTLEWNGVTNANAGYRVTMLFEYWEAGTKWGTFPMGHLAWVNFLDFGGLYTFVSGNWSVTTPAQFANGGTNPFQSLRRGLWNQNTDFHPYRTRP